jgi:hypothetical protein
VLILKTLNANSAIPEAVQDEVIHRCPRPQARKVLGADKRYPPSSLPLSRPTFLQAGDIDSKFLKTPTVSAVTTSTTAHYVSIITKLKRRMDWYNGHDLVVGTFV